MGMWDRFRYRRGTTAYWAANNYTLGVGEPGWDTVLRMGKVGDGVTAWNDLPISFGTGVAPAPPSATESTAGVARLATSAEATSGTSLTTAMSPARVKQLVDAMRTTLLGGASAAYDTLQELVVEIQNAEESSVISALTTVVGGKLQKDQNLADLPDKALARANLGVSAGGGGGILTPLSTYGGAVGGNYNAAFQAFQQAAKDGIVAPVSTAANDRSGTVSLGIPAGTYRITSANGLLGAVAMTQKGSGLRIQGAGSGITNIVFAPGVVNTLVYNDMWLDIHFEGISFYCETPGSIFMKSYSTSQAQEFSWTDCVWLGPWKHQIDLKGNNNNSELRYINCGTTGMQNTGAFLNVDPKDNTDSITDTSDQFLNYWFYGFKHWSTSAPIIRAHRGGHFNFWGVDASDWGVAGGTYLFELRGENHALGVCNFIGDGVRVEAKSATARLLYSEWPHGTVEFSNADWSSQMSTFTYSEIIDIKYSNFGGPTYAFRSCNLAGGVWVSYGGNDWGAQHRIVFEDCELHQRLTPSEFVVYDDSRNSGNATRPTVQFVRCRGDEQSIYGPNGATVWDATMGYAGETATELKLRQLSLRSPNGMLADGSGAIKFSLPVGAMITGLRVLAPAGSVSEGDGGSWVLKTTETTPVTVATATVTTPGLSSGYNVQQAVSPPYLCSTRQKATLTLATTGVAQWSPTGILLVEGYW